MDAASVLQSPGDIGSFVGGLAVAMTLAFLAVQFRQNQRAAQVTAAETVMLSMSEYFRSLSESPQLAHVISVVYRNFETLEDEEVTQCFCRAFAYFRLVELAHHHVRQGHIGLSFWKCQTEQLAGLMTIPAVARFCRLRREIFSSDLQVSVDGLEASRSIPAGLALIRCFNGGEDG
jgi:hypothetical protein